MYRHWKTVVALTLAAACFAGSEPPHDGATTKPATRTPITLSVPKRSAPDPKEKLAAPTRTKDAKDAKEPKEAKDKETSKPSSKRVEPAPEDPKLSREPEVTIGESPAAPAWSSAKHLLTEGNARFADGAAIAPRRDEARRCELAAGQHPVAAVLSCADSRVPVELLFDQGLGDIFSVRVAGNVATPSEIASLEYAVEHLNTPLIVVMGHTKCGAVRAAVDGTPLDGALGQLISEVRPAADEAKLALPQNVNSNAVVSAAVRANVRLAARNLTSRSDTLAEAVRSGKVRIECAVYDILSGTVQWLEDDQQPSVPAKLLGSASASAEGGEAEMLKPAAEHNPEPVPEKHVKDLKVEIVEPKKHAKHEAELPEPKSKHDAKREEKKEPEDDADDEHHDEKSPKKSKSTTQPVAATLANPKDRWIVIGSASVALFAVTASLAQFAARKKHAAKPARSAEPVAH